MTLLLSPIWRRRSAGEAPAKRWTRLSPLVRGGLALCAAGAIADVIGHAGLAAAATGAHSAAALQYAGHLVTMAGMVLILLEVIGAGLRRPRGRARRAVPPDTAVPGRTPGT